jgi:Cu(I)/Ag(I) efflux system membrane fusion protein
MKTKKNIIILILGCLFFGGVIGWLVRGVGKEDKPISADDTAGETIWVSPMHPHIRQNEPGNCPICGMELVPLSQFTSSTNSDPYVLEMTPEAMALANVSTTKVYGGGAGRSIELVGKIRQNEQGIQSLTANFSGRIDRLFVNFTGDEVLKGQKLATVYSPDLINAQRELLEAAKIKDRQPALYEAAIQKLKSWKLTDAQIASLQEDGQVKTQVDIISDKAGVVSRRNVALGDFVSRGQAMFEILDLGKVWVLLDVYESDIASVKIGNEVKFKVSAYPERDFSAKVSFVDPMLNDQTRTITVRAEATNPDYQLKPGMFVNATIQSNNAGKSGVFVPKSAVLWTGPRSVVYVQVGTPDNPKFQLREVVIGPATGDAYQISSGLDLGEEVVSNGVFAVDAAAQLSGNFSMMALPEKAMETPLGFQQSLKNIIEAYSDLKDAFVKSNAGSVDLAIAPLAITINEAMVSELPDKESTQWEGFVLSLRKSLNGIQSSTDLERKRTDFEALSEALIATIEYFGNGEMQLYKQYCPMAFGDKGANWLSQEKEIRNPYFGDKMLTCGEVKKNYAPSKPN